MKFTPVALLSLLSLVANAKDGDNTNLRASGSSREGLLELDVDVDDSNCHAMKSQSDCASATDEATNASCVWCKCSAVPPVCVSPEESNSLPPGVFECDASATATAASSESNDDSLPVYDFGLKDGRTIQLREKINERGSEDAEFCDASSKSISGYMDLKGSKVCFLFCVLCVFQVVRSFSAAGRISENNIIQYLDSFDFFFQFRTTSVLLINILYIYLHRLCH